MHGRLRASLHYRSNLVGLDSESIEIKSTEIKSEVTVSFLYCFWHARLRVPLQLEHHFLLLKPPP